MTLLAVSSHIVVSSRHDDEVQSDYSLSSVDKTAHSKKNLLDRLQGSFDTAIDFLVYHGVDQSSIDELRADLRMKRFLPVMRRIQSYMERYAETNHKRREKGDDEADDEDETHAAVYMSTMAWSALCDYLRLIHQRVYAEYTDLLCASSPTAPLSLSSHHSMHLPTLSSSSCHSVQLAPDHHKQLLKAKRLTMNQLGEYLCASQVGLLRAQNWGHSLEMPEK